ncbi:G-protein coupled receptor 151-like [Myxocyprinus asiaticus]|uniref:G-protein coupled receptor 151-like n=1 Tax=Myxocyprinus asiaticus TaxID=70543 RepID=UPI0022218A93|nr:G-protein coupled receptor 151-like [Myxocyprinus asiaticus]
MEKSPGVNISAGNGSVDRRSFLERSGYQHLDQGDLRVLIPVVLGIICVLGFTGNVTAMGVLLTNARKGKLSMINTLILNLMLADGLVLAFAVPFKAAAYSRATWTLGLFVCKTCDWFLHSCMAAKSFTVAIMAKACYRYVSNPTKQVTFRLKTILVVLLLSWLLACVVPIPQWLFATLQREANGVICVQTVPADAHDFMSVYVKAYPLVAYCTPLSFALLYFWKAYGRCQHRSSKTQNLRTQIRSRKLTLMLFSLTVATATMWLPQWVSWVWMRHALETEGTFPPVLFTLSAQLLMFSISLVNPLIVLALSEEFREGYIGLWRRLTLRKHPPKSKPGPHTPTAPKSPTPRPETSAHLPPHQPGQTEEQMDQSEEKQESPTNKDGIVLQDVEQFWHERETGSQSHENDPLPWEHQDPREGKQ